MSACLHPCIRCIPLQRCNLAPSDSTCSHWMHIHVAACDMTSKMDPSPLLLSGSVFETLTTEFSTQRHGAQRSSRKQEIQSGMRDMQVRNHPFLQYAYSDSSVAQATNAEFEDRIRRVKVGRPQSLSCRKICANRQLSQP